MSYILAQRIHDHRKAKALEAAEKLGYDMDKAMRLASEYRAKWHETKEEKYLRLTQWAGNAVLGIRCHNGENIRF
jgi:hypothetical protein